MKAHHRALMLQFQSLRQQGLFPQSLLLVGPRHAGSLELVHRVIAMMLCSSEISPCGHCRECHLLSKESHPDVQEISLENDASVIKIESIRQLQQDVYQSPQRGKYRFVVIHPAEQLNASAANALLKILEEPPPHTMFVLITEQVQCLLPTIISRCQMYVVPSPELFLDHDDNGYLSLGAFYPSESPRALLMQQQQALIVGLRERVENKASPITLASAWSSYALSDMLWLLYLITAAMIRYRVIGGESDDGLAMLSRLFSPVTLFMQLEKIQSIMGQQHRHIALNATLVLEEVFLGYEVA